MLERLHFNSAVDENVGIFITRADGTVEWSPCWFWFGHIDRFGYGRLPQKIKVKGYKKKQPRNRQAHRVSYFAHKGLPYKSRWPVLMHQCDRRPCIHPDHVNPGTHKENYAEMVARGRAPWQAVQSREPGEDDE